MTKEHLPQETWREVPAWHWHIAIKSIFAGSLAAAVAWFVPAWTIGPWPNLVWMTIAVGALAVPFVYLVSAWSHNRQLRMQNWHTHHGWTYSKRERHPLMLAGFDPPGDHDWTWILRSGRKPCDFAWKQLAGRTMLVHSYVIPGGEDSSDTPMIRLVMDTGTQLPRISLVRRRFADWDLLGVFKRLKRVPFDDRRFNRSWKACSDDVEKTQALLDQDVLGFLCNLHGKLAFEIADGVLVAELKGRGLRGRWKLIESVLGLAEAAGNDLIRFEYQEDPAS